MIRIRATARHYGTRQRGQKVLGYRRVSPIFVRPVREQLEHDRLIRFLIPKYKRKFEVAVNVGDEQAAPVRFATATLYPDLVLTTNKKLAGVVEIESAESVNNLEAMAQWVPFSRSRVPFHLYVPVQTYDVARRFCDSNQASVTEIWTYRPAADGFDLVRMFHDADAPNRLGRKAGPAAKVLPRPEPVAKPEPTPEPKAEPAPKAEAKPSARPQASAKPQPPGKANKAAAKPAASAPKPPAPPKGAAKPPVKAAAKPSASKTAAKPAAKPPARTAKPVAKKPPRGKAAPGRSR
jgi:hypothetical protein